MVSEYNPLLSRALDATSLLDDTSRPDAQELVRLSQRVLSSSSVSGVVPLNQGEAELALKKRLGVLVEVLARREARAIPFAALGRAALASLYGAAHETKRLLREFEDKLSMLGF